MDRLGVGEALEAVCAEVAGLDRGDERRRRGGEEHLTAVAGGGDAVGADHIEPRVALVPEVR